MSGAFNRSQQLSQRCWLAAMDAINVEFQN
jgi:hypothetical protein